MYPASLLVREITDYGIQLLTETETETETPSGTEAKIRSQDFCLPSWASF